MRSVIWLSVCLLHGITVYADDASAFFNVQILPILRSRCYECHSRKDGAEGGLALDSRSGWEVGGDHGPAVTPHNLQKSPLIRAIRHLDSNSAMPPKKKLPPLEIAMLETWVLLGAPDPRTDELERNGSTQPGK